MKQTKFNRLTNTPDPVCAYKWGWSTVFLQRAETSSCHRTTSDKLVPGDFANFHNTPIKLRTRRAMLNGDWPGYGCEYCKKIEQAGGISDRLDFNNHDDVDQYIPSKLRIDQNAFKISPTMLEMYFSNLCNMNCVYCDPTYSSKWEAEAKKFGLRSEEWFKERMLSREDYEKVLAEFWVWFKENCRTLKKYNILGGEPFFQPELYQNIDFFETMPCPELQVTVFSNLKVEENKFRNTLKQIQSLVDRKHLKSFRITASLDCWGPQQEYVRTGLSLTQWEKNFRILRREFPDIAVQIHGTISCLTIKTLPELMELINEVNFGKEHWEQVHWSHNLVVSPKHMAPGIFPEGYFDEDFEKIISLMPQEMAKQTMRGYQKTINAAPYDHGLILTLKEELTKIDQRRNMDHRPLFPWLEDFT